MEKYRTIQECIKRFIEIKTIKSFYPTAVIKNVDETKLEDVIYECNQWVAKGKLKRKYEVRCPECFHIIGVYDEINKIPKHVDCIMCMREIETDNINPFLVYEVVR